MARSFSSSVSSPSSSDEIVIHEQVTTRVTDGPSRTVIRENSEEYKEVKDEGTHTEVVETINEIEIDGVLTKEIITTTTTTNKHIEVIARESSSSSSSSSSDEEVLDTNVRRVVRRVERQAPRLLEHEEYVVENAGAVIKEYEFEEQVAVEYTGIREDIVEHIVAVPIVEETQTRSHHAEATRIVEIEKPVTVHRIVEVPQVEIVETLKEVPTPSGRISKKFNYVPKKKIVPQERKIIIERPVERVVEIDDITYVDTEEIIETIEIPEYQDVIKVTEKKVPTIVEVPYEVVEEIDEVTDVDVLIPVGVEAETKVTYNVPTIIEKRAAKGYPVYVPRFIESPTSSIHLSKDQRVKSKALLNQMKELEHSMRDGAKIVSACEIEKMGVAARDHQTCIQGHIDSSDLKKSLINVFGRSDSAISSDSLKQKKKKEEEGYYGHANVTGAWTHIEFDARSKSSHSSIKSSSHSTR